MHTHPSRRRLLATLAAGFCYTNTPISLSLRGVLGCSGRLTPWPERFYPTSTFNFPSGASEFDLATARAMAWAAQLAYEDDRNKIELILSRWGWKLRGEPFNRATDGSSNILPARGYIADADDVTLLAFSGTEPTEVIDLCTDLFATHFNEDGIHQGFADAIADVQNKIASTLKTGGGVLTNRLYIAGHSLGGALAAVMALRLRQSGQVDAKRIQIVTLGMPRTGTEKFADIYRAAGLGMVTYRLVYGVDLVPQLPPPYSPFGFRHVGNLLACPQSSSFDPKAIATDAPEPGPSVTLTSIADAVRGWAPSNDAPAFPGRCGWFAKSEPWPVRDHLTDSYLRALGELKNP